MKNWTKKNYFEILFLLALIGIIALQFLPNLFKQETITIAITVSTQERAENFTGGRMVDGVQLYVDKINAAGGVNGKQLLLEIHDDRLDPEVTAQEIVNSSAIAVLGHSTSKNSLEAGKIYQKYGIPAISGSATADEITNSKWYFRTTFNNTEQGQFLANYLEYVVAAKNIYLIYEEDDPYSLTLTKAIKTRLNSFDRQLVGEQKIDRNENIEKASKRIIQDLLRLKEGGQNPDAIIITTQSVTATGIIPIIKLNGLDYPIFGGDSLANSSFPMQFAETPQEREKIGFFTNGIHSITPVIFDIADSKAQNFKNEFYQRYNYEPGWVATLYYDAAHAIIQAMQNILEQQKDLPQNVFTGQNSKRDRELIRQGLAQINSPDTAIQGITRKFYFDEKGNTSAPILMGIFNRRNFISDFIQLSPIDNINHVYNLERQLNNGEIFQVNGQYFQKTNIIYTGIDVNEIYNIDEKTSSYLIDFYLWFKYREVNINPENIVFLNYDTNRLDSGETLTLNEPIEVNKNDGITHSLFQLKADFYDKFDFHNYPFDRQILSVKFQHKNLTRNRIIYVLDLAGMRDTKKNEILKNFQENDVFGTITDWHVQNAIFYQNTDIDESTLGYEYLLDTNSQFEYSQFNVEIEIARDIISFILKNLLPLWFFTFVTYSLMFLPFDDISVEAIGGVLLAVVFYHLSLLDSLPDGVGYVVALDYAFYLLYFLIGLQLFIVILGNSRRFQATGVQQFQLVQFGKIAFPIIWLIGCFVWYSIYA
ncbi:MULTISPECIES: ABC transporter substrate-binding protein [Spirulina sp. CCY15215]|uniref:ABC transporter substrate-binding protein n=1 Tax=Spirulina sp. CCY15215 TaxID=2767591 RepID=UPI001951FB04|nr:ABC transporter substrate-binding protein [Spirulina major]